MRYLSLCVLIGSIVLQSACSTDPEKQDGPMDFPEHFNPSAMHDARPHSESPSRYGNPTHYEVNGKRYYVQQSNENFQQVGIASWYGKKFHGRKTSSGEVYDMFAMTAAHKTLPIPSYVKVTNQRNGLTTVVRVNDRGPFHSSRIIDLSYAAALKLDIANTGTAPVKIEAIDTSAKQDQQKPPQQDVNTDQNKIIQAPIKQLPSHSRFVQLGVFAELDNAKRLQHKIMNSSLPTPKVISANINDSDLYRVLIGPLISEKHIQAINHQLNQMGIQPTQITAPTRP
ncbi:MAG: septal ring lytic transglycosylase RlpA family protein [Methylococcales bacterium]